MDETQDGGWRAAAEDLILRTIAAHADSLLRTARRHSICIDDAHDAYQRAIELFMAHAQRLDAARAPGWLHVVVKREAIAIARSRRKLVMPTDVDFDMHEADRLPTPEEQLLSLDMMNRSAEALKRLKPQELRALWLRAQGNSYSEISAITGWSYTKVNRCLSEGRRHFLEQYEGIESGAECERWLPVLSALVDGEATPEEILEVRPHLRNCPGCRATLRALQDSSTPLAALLPVPLLVVDAGFGDRVVQLATRVHDVIAANLYERAINSFTKAQAVFEASASGKVAAVAASAAAVAGGGYASVDRFADRPIANRTVSAPASRGSTSERWSPSAAQAKAIRVSPATTAPGASRPTQDASRTSAVLGRLRRASEFGVRQRAAPVWSGNAVARSSFSPETAHAPARAAAAAREFTPRDNAPAFGP